MGLHCLNVLVVSFVVSTLVRLKVDSSAAFKNPDIHVDLKAGVVCEPTGTILSHSGLVYIPVTYSIPTELTVVDPLCAKFGSIAEMHKQVLLHLTRLIPTRELPLTRMDLSIAPRSRPKRWIGAMGVFGAILSGGVAAWNRISINSLQDTMKNLQESQAMITSRVKSLSRTTTAVINNQEQIFHMVGDIITTLNAVTKDLTCEASQRVVTNEYIASWLIFAPSEFMRALDGALTGHLTPELMNAQNARDLLVNHLEMKNTVYTHDISLLYELGSFVTSSISNDPPMIMGVMILPLIHPVDLGVLYSCYSVGWINNTDLIRIVLPKIIARSQGHVPAWAPDKTSCQSSPGFLVCPKRLSTESTERCTEAALDHSSRVHCPLEIRRKPQKSDIIQMRTGVLVGPDATGLHLVKISDGRQVNLGTVDTSQVSQFFTSEDGDYLMDGDKLYSLIEMRDKFEFKQLNITLGGSDVDRYGLLTTSNWIRVDQLPPVSLDLPLPTGHEWIIYTIIMIVMSIGIALGCKYLWTQYRIWADMKKSHKNPEVHDWTEMKPLQ